MAVKAQCDKGDRGILLVIAQVAGWSYCSWSGASVFVFSVQLDSPVHTHIQFAVRIDLHKIQLAVDHLQNVTTAKSGGLHCSTWHIKATNNQKLKLTVTTLEIWSYSFLLVMLLASTEKPISDYSHGDTPWCSELTASWCKLRYYPQLQTNMALSKPIPPPLLTINGTWEKAWTGFQDNNPTPQMYNSLTLQGQKLTSISLKFSSYNSANKLCLVYTFSQCWTQKL